MNWMRSDYVGDPDRQCKGKVGWQTKKKAKLHARRQGNMNLRAYRCPHCGSFHLGTKP